MQGKRCQLCSFISVCVFWKLAVLRTPNLVVEIIHRELNLAPRNFKINFAIVPTKTNYWLRPVSTFHVSKTIRHDFNTLRPFVRV